MRLRRERVETWRKSRALSNSNQENEIENEKEKEILSTKENGVEEHKVNGEGKKRKLDETIEDEDEERKRDREEGEENGEEGNEEEEEGGVKKKKWSLSDDEEDDEEEEGELKPMDTEQDELDNNKNKMEIESKFQFEEKKTEEKENEKEEEDDDEIDPLDAFMAGVTTEVDELLKKDVLRGNQNISSKNATSLEDKEDEGSDSEFETTEPPSEQDLLALAQKVEKKKELQLVDHSKIDYEPFKKNFYIETQEIAKMTPEETKKYRFELDGIKIRGLDCPKPIKKWFQAGLNLKVLDVLKDLGFEKPTPIQAQAIPAIMSGRDVIGIAKTGSGKTLAFLIPMFRHILDQRPLDNGEGPIGLILTPTRELAVQIYTECRKFIKPLKLKVKIFFLFFFFFFLFPVTLLFIDYSF